VPPVRIALAALLLLALDTPSAQPGFHTALSFDVGSNPFIVAVADFNRDGIPDLAVANVGQPPSTDQGSVSVLLGKGDGTFQPAVNYPADISPFSVAVADFNGDGIPDLVAANFFSDNVSVLLGNGDGTFQPTNNYSAGHAPFSVAVGDFNGDGVPDLAVANFGGGTTGLPGTLSILLGNGDGSLQAPISYPAGLTPYSVAVGDFNRDGHADLVIVNAVKQGAVSVFLGNGDGTFQAPRSYPAGNGPVCVAVGDFNGDGIPDVAVTENGATILGTMVSILLGNGDGTFQPGKTYTVDFNPFNLAVGDFNGDGHLDLAVSNFGLDGGGTVSVLLGNGDGSFQAAQNYAVGWSVGWRNQGTSSVAVGDFNGDGKLDLVVANAGGNNASVLLGKGDGTFQAAPNYSAGSTSLNVAVGDFNGDGILDLAVANAGTTPGFQGTVSIFLGNGDGTLRAAVNYAVGHTSICVAVGDFNRDGILDLVVSNYSSKSVSVLLGNGDGTFRAAVDYPAGNNPYSVTVADFNRDGIPDLAVTNSVQGQVSILLGNGDGTFQAAQSYLVGTRPTSVAVGDFNGDGIADLVVTNNATVGGVSVLLGNGDGTFQKAVNYDTDSDAYAVAVADLNGDGILDLVVASSGSNDVSVLLGKGEGTFLAAVNYIVGPHPVPFMAVGPAPNEASATSLAVRDFNGDGVPDLAVVFGGGVRVLLGNGDGTFQTTPISYVAGAGPVSIAVGDFNGDGFPDLAVANFDSDGGASILLNDGKWTP
jgi:hypothetical protein